jgi:hypothetical protein
MVHDSETTDPCQAADSCACERRSSGAAIAVAGGLHPSAVPSCCPTFSALTSRRLACCHFPPGTPSLSTDLLTDGRSSSSLAILPA